MFKIKPKVVEHILTKIEEVKQTYSLTHVDLARITGYERSSLHRILRNGKPTLIMLIRLSEHFGMSIDFWFPTELISYQPRELPNPKGCVCDGAPKAVVSILTALKKSSDAEKKLLLDAIQSPEMMSLIEEISSLGTEKKQALLSLIPEFAKLGK